MVHIFHVMLLLASARGVHQTGERLSAALLERSHHFFSTPDQNRVAFWVNYSAFNLQGAIAQLALYCDELLSAITMLTYP
jgi:hypothetical protein